MPKPEPELIQMPPHILKGIVLAGDADVKRSLRRTTKLFTPIVDSSPVSYISLQVLFQKDKITLKWVISPQTTVNLTLVKLSDDSCTIENPNEPNTYHICHRDYREVAARKILGIFKNSKFNLNTLELEIAGKSDLTEEQLEEFEEEKKPFFDAFQAFAVQKTFKLPIKDLKILFKTSQTNISSILTNLKPKFLKSINLGAHHWEERTDLPIMTEIGKLEQWKMAKEVAVTSCVYRIPMEDFLHFDVLDIIVNLRPNKTMREILDHFLTQPTFQRCHINCYYEFNLTNIEKYSTSAEMWKFTGHLFWVKHQRGESVQVLLKPRRIMIGLLFL